MVKYSAQALKTLARMQPRLRHRIEAAVDAYAENPATAQNVKKLKGRNELRIRVGNWRIIITDDGLVVAVIRVKPRGSAYKK